MIRICGGPCLQRMRLRSPPCTALLTLGSDQLLTSLLTIGRGERLILHARIQMSKKAMLKRLVPGLGGSLTKMRSFEDPDNTVKFVTRQDTRDITVGRCHMIEPGYATLSECGPPLKPATIPLTALPIVMAVVWQGLPDCTVHHLMASLARTNNHTSGGLFAKYLYFTRPCTSIHAI